MNLINLQKISKSYKGNNVLDNISLSVAEGEMLSIMGRSGAGKTTLLNIIGLLDNSDSGEYFWGKTKIDTKNDDLSSKYRLNDIGFIVQNYALISNKTVFENIALPLQCMKISKKEIVKKVEEIANKTKIIEMLNKYPYQLSGGECQRVAISRALIRNPKLILADEPTGALDENTEKEIIHVLSELSKDGVAVIIVTHNPNVADICKRKLVINDGKLIENT